MNNMGKSSSNDIQTELDIEDVLQLVRDIAETMPVQQDFIFMTGLYRIEYHSKQKVLVTEQRLFDRINLNEEETE